MYYDNSQVVPANTSRKRPRSNDDDSHSLMPTSKKFVDSDVRNIFPDSSSLSVDSVSKIQYQNTLNNADVVMSDVQSPYVITSSLPVDIHQQYKPELSVIENPYYYHVNEILYVAHMQRIYRQSNGS